MHDYNYSLDANPASFNASCDLYGSDWFLQPILPSVKCSVCGIKFTAPALPQVERIFRDLTLSAEEAAKCSNTLEILNCRLNDIANIGKLTYMKRDAFQDLATDLRRWLGLGPQFPLLPQARIAPLHIRHTSKRNMPIARHLGEGQFTVSADAALKIQLAKFEGVELVGCNLDPSGQERYELVVLGMGNVEATDWEISAYYVERLKRENTPFAYARCPECNMIPIRAKLQGSNFKVESQYDLFRLRDFSGIYASPRAREVLTEVCDVGLKFEPV